MQRSLRSLRRHSITTLAALTALLVSFGTASARIGFQRITPLDQMVDPVRFPPRIGFANSVWDTSAVDTAVIDSSLLDSLAIDSLTLDSLSLDTLTLDSLAIDSLTLDSLSLDTLTLDSLAIDSLTLDSLSLDTLTLDSLQIDSLLIDTLKADTLAVDSTLQKPTDAVTGTDTGSATGNVKGVPPVDVGKGGKGEGEAAVAKADTLAPPPWHPTNINHVGIPLTTKTTIDTSSGYMEFSHIYAGNDIGFGGALPTDEYIRRQAALFDRDNRRQSIMTRLPSGEKKEGTGIEIKWKVSDSKKFGQIFGGQDIGLNVTGQIQIDGSLTTEKKDEIQADNKNPTNYAFKINQKQQFNIKGKVGEKVTVEIDQDSEKLFEFENSLRVRYKGDEDEIVQSVEAGNVSLSLGGTRLATASSNHKGLFGFKTESKFGALKLTTIASLDKGEKNTKKISGGSQKSDGVKIKPKDYAQGRYYFLDYDYRENYKYYDANMKHVRYLASTIKRLDVYKSVRPGEDPNAVTGWAYSNTVGGIIPNQEKDQEHQPGDFIRLEPVSDYSYSEELGYIRLARPLDNETILAAAWSSTNSRGEETNYGDLDPSDNNPETNPFLLVLLQPKGPQPSDATWDLMWRNVYDLRATGINQESFSAKITKTDGDQIQETDGTKTYLAIFDLDLFNVGIPGQDGKIDPNFVNLAYGELMFPDLHPFDPEGWYQVDGEGNPVLVETKVTPENRDTLLYKTVIGYNRSDQLRNDFTIVVQYSDASSSYNLGFGVLEGSEEVTLNGKRLARGADYSIDYITGSLTINNKDATAPGADLEIKYETGQIFQLDTQTMLGIRAEYELWDNSTFGGTLLHLSQKTVEQRVRVGGEPKENTVWDLNTTLRFEPEFLTRAVDWLPLIETDTPSKITITGEIAQVFPNPNSLNSTSTGDPNGVAYIDDFESVKRTTPLGITRRQWTLASYPVADSRGLGRWEKQRGRLLWYNPTDQDRVQDIWPNREIGAENSSVQVLRLDYQPWWSAWGGPTPAGIDPRKSWAGVMRYLGPGYADQSQSKYIEIWLKRIGPVGTVYIDLGRLSEDVIADGKSATEDHPLDGYYTGDGSVTADEDVGIDGVAGVDPADSSYVNGLDHPLLPSYDDWSANTSGSEWTYLNGTEGNGTKSPSDEGGRIPDTEDLSGDGFPDAANDFYRYRIDLSEGDNNRYIVGGLGLPVDKDKGWRLYRIPLTDTLTIGRPNFTQLDYARLWLTGFAGKATVKIATMEIVGNEWQEQKVDDGRGGFRDPVNIAVVNTHDNPEYNTDQPPGVAGEVDPVTALREKEQSLVLRVDKLGVGETGSALKTLSPKLNLLEYRQVKMFVHGGGTRGALVDRYGRPLDLEMFFRFGSEIPRARSQAHYYEYSQRLSPGWAPSNEIVIDLERLASLKFLRESDSTHDYDILPDGDVIRVVGSPSLRSIGFLEIGLKNHGQEITPQDGVEIWVDELRVSDIYRNTGWAAFGQTSVSFADLLDISADLTQRQADFHNLNERSKADPADQLSGSFNTELQVGEVFDKRLGIKVPLSLQFKQDISVPKFKPNSDVKLAAISAENPRLWSRFMKDLTTANRFRQPQSEEGAIDSLISTDKNYTLRGSFAKSAKSENWWTRYTLDNLKFGGSFQEIWGRDYRSLLEYKRISAGNVSYVIALEKPVELNWMKWASDVPVLNRISESTFKPIPTSLNLSANGNETYNRTYRRDGVKTGDTTFTIDRSYSTAWRPFTILNFDYSQSIGSQRVIEDTMRTIAATGMLNPDSSMYYHDTDSGRVFDEAGWQVERARQIQGIKDKLFWKGFGYYFVDDKISQRFNTGFSPVLLSWLGTESSYNTSYSWGWSKALRSSDRYVRANATFNGTLTLRLPQLTAGWKAENDLPAPNGGADKFMPGGKMPVMDKGATGKPNGEFGSGDIENFGSGGMPFDEAFAEGDSTRIPVIMPVDSLAVDTLAGDTVVDEGKRITPPNPLKLAKIFISRIRDVQYTYTQTGDASNAGVGAGQADWAYRLGFTRDPGLDSVRGYYRETYGLTVRNRISTGYDITQKLTLNSIEMTYSESKNLGQQISGSSQRPVFMYFGSDKITIKKVPAANWSARWTGWEDFPYVRDWANSISLDHGFNGSQTEQWRKVHSDSAREVTTIDYEKTFQPLLGMTFAWKGGVGTNASYNWSQSVQDQRTGLSAKSRNTTSSISLTGSYTSRKGFRIPIPVWPFKNRRFDNSTTFSLSYRSNNSTRDASAGGGQFESRNWSKSWSVTPSIDYTFSSAVRGGFRYTYSAQSSNLTSSKSQEFGFTVNISIRG